MTRQMAYKIIWRNEADKHPSQIAFLAEVVGMDCYTIQMAPSSGHKWLNHYFDLKALKALQTQLNEYLENK